MKACPLLAAKRYILVEDILLCLKYIIKMKLYRVFTKEWCGFKR